MTEQRIIQNHFKDFFDQQDISMRKLAREIDVPFNTIYRLYHDKFEYLNYDLLNKIINYFEIDDLQQLFTIIKQKPNNHE